jgi:hypothetical protein
VLRELPADAIDAVRELRDAVKEHQSADGESKKKTADIVESLSIHRVAREC